MRKILTTLLMSMSVMLLHAQFDKVDNWMEENASDMGGRLVLMVYKDGKLVHSKTVNELTRRQKMAGRLIARRTGKEVNTEDFTVSTKIAIASCSKWLSAALVMRMVDEGKLKLTDTVGKFFPVLSRNGKGGITISQCLSHTTGIKAEGLKENLEEMRTLSSMEESVEKIAELPVEGKPGTVFRYSNVGLQIAGAVLEKISGKKFAELFAEKIAAPLEMRSTDWGKGKVPLPAGGAFSTASDYLNFTVMILNKGMYKGKRILSKAAVKEMQVNRIVPGLEVAHAPAEAGNFGYGFGEWVMETSSATNTTRTVTSPGLFGSFPWVDNEKKYCAILLSFNLKSKGRNEKYKEIKSLVDEAIR